MQQIINITNILSELITYRKAFENELRNDIQKYWMDKGIDKINGGFCGAADLYGNQVLTTRKSCVLNARILWTFSSAAMLYPDPRYEQMADLAWNIFQDKFADKKFGGYYMELNPDNTVANDIKHTYVQAFVIFAISRYYEFRKSEEVLKTLKAFFFLLESKALDRENKGFIIGLYK
jgi:mannobiose 2-epimerase